MKEEINQAGASIPIRKSHSADRESRRHHYPPLTTCGFPERVLKGLSSEVGSWGVGGGEREGEVLYRGVEGLSSSSFTGAANSCSGLPEILEKRKGKVQGRLRFGRSFSHSGNHFTHNHNEKTDNRQHDMKQN